MEASGTTPASSSTVIRTDLDVTLVLSSALSKLITQGFTLPVTVAIVAINGASMLGRFESGAKAEPEFTVLADHVPDGTFPLPINVMFVDTRGEVAVAGLAAPDLRPQFLDV